MRRLMQRQAENSYRKMEAFIINRLKEIMKGNRFEFFIPKVPSHYLVILLAGSSDFK
jgi:[histone H3]-lysine4 N-trimethyltransferase ATXR3